MKTNIRNNFLLWLTLRFGLDSHPSYNSENSSKEGEWHYKETKEENWQTTILNKIFTKKEFLFGDGVAEPHDEPRKQCEE